MRDVLLTLQILQGPLSIDDFELITVIGKGSFGKESSLTHLYAVCAFQAPSLQILYNIHLSLFSDLIS